MSSGLGRFAGEEFEWAELETELEIKLENKLGTKLEKTFNRDRRRKPATETPKTHLDLTPKLPFRIE
jgi:hypothetical protein